MSLKTIISAFLPSVKIATIIAFVAVVAVFLSVTNSYAQETQERTCYDTCQEAKEVGLRNFTEGDSSLVCCCQKTAEGNWTDAALEACEVPDVPKAAPTPLEDSE